MKSSGLLPSLSHAESSLFKHINYAELEVEILPFFQGSLPLSLKRQMTMVNIYQDLYTKPNTSTPGYFKIKICCLSPPAPLKHKCMLLFFPQGSFLFDILSIENLNCTGRCWPWMSVPRIKHVTKQNVICKLISLKKEFVKENVLRFLISHRFKTQSHPKTLEHT